MSMLFLDIPFLICYPARKQTFSSDSGYRLLLSVPSGEKYCRSSWSWAPAERDRMLMAAASVMAPPNPLTFWYFW